MAGLGRNRRSLTTQMTTKFTELGVSIVLRCQEKSDDWLKAEAIRRWKPWERSTGLKTEGGKAASSSNAYKGRRSPRALFTELGRLLRAQKEALEG